MSPAMLSTAKSSFTLPMTWFWLEQHLMKSALSGIVPPLVSAEPRAATGRAARG
jgi:hypothetical protein